MRAPGVLNVLQKSRTKINSNNDDDADAEIFGMIPQSAEVTAEEIAVKLDEAGLSREEQDEGTSNYIKIIAEEITKFFQIAYRR